MFGSNVLEIGIGLIFVYLLVSLVCTACNELIASFTRSRANDLERGIANLLEGTSGLFKSGKSGTERADARRTAQTNAGVKTAGTLGWTRSFFAHSLVNALSKDGQRPSYVPSQTFAMVLIDLVAKHATEASSKLYGWLKANNIKQDSGLPWPNVELWLKQGKAEEHAKAVADLAIPGAGGVNIPASDVIRNWLASSAPSTLRGDSTFDEIRNVVAMIGNDYVKEALLALIEEAASDVSKTTTDLKKVNDQIETWFNNAMDRVSGWYKRRTQISLAIVAVLVTFVLNIDTVAICRNLGKQDTLRPSIVAAAQRFADHSAEAGKNPTGGTGGAGNASFARDGDNLKSVSAKIQADVGQIDELGIPIGWTYNAADGSTKHPRVDDLHEVFSHWSLGVTKIVGLLLTALAASLGAPFWFDMLNKIMSIRSAGKPPEDNPKPPRSVPKAANPEDTPSPQAHKLVIVAGDPDAKPGASG